MLEENPAKINPPLPLLSLVLPAKLVPGWNREQESIGYISQ